MNIRRIAAVVALIAVFRIEWSVLLYAAQEWGCRTVLIGTVASSAIGLLIVRYALRRFGPTAFQTLKMYRSQGWVYSPDHSLENSLLNMVGFLVAGVGLLIPGLITDVVALFVLASRPLRTLAANAVLWVVAPRIFLEEEGDPW